MAESIANYLVFAAYAYALIGTVFAVAFACFGVDQVDNQAKGSGWGFRALIFPGCIAFWPLLLRRWSGFTGEPPEKRNLHR